MLESRRRTKFALSVVGVLTLFVVGTTLTSAALEGEQLLVRFLTAIVVAALLLYIISDFRLQTITQPSALDSKFNQPLRYENRSGSIEMPIFRLSRKQTIEPPENSTAAFMASVNETQVLDGQIEPQVQRRGEPGPNSQYSAMGRISGKHRQIVAARVSFDETPDTTTSYVNRSGPGDNNVPPSEERSAEFYDQTAADDRTLNAPPMVHSLPYHAENSADSELSLHERATLEHRDVAAQESSEISAPSDSAVEPDNSLGDYQPSSSSTESEILLPPSILPPPNAQQQVVYKPPSLVSATTDSPHPPVYPNSAALGSSGDSEVDYQQANPQPDFDHIPSTATPVELDPPTERTSNTDYGLELAETNDVSFYNSDVEAEAAPAGDSTNTLGSEGAEEESANDKTVGDNVVSTVLETPDSVDSQSTASQTTVDPQTPNVHDVAEESETAPDDTLTRQHRRHYSGSEVNTLDLQPAELEVFDLAFGQQSPTSTGDADSGISAVESPAELETINAAICDGEKTIINSLIDRGVLSADGPISDDDITTMVYVAFTSAELRNLLLSGGTVDTSGGEVALAEIEIFTSDELADSDEFLLAVPEEAIAPLEAKAGL